MVQSNDVPGEAQCDHLMWQDIATAPKFGTHVLIFTPERCENCSPTTQGIVVAHWDNGAWITGKVVGGGKTYFTHKPTHWMPLPSPPSGDRKSSPPDEETA